MLRHLSFIMVHVCCIDHGLCLRCVEHASSSFATRCCRVLIFQILKDQRRLCRPRRASSSSLPLRALPPTRWAPDGHHFGAAAVVCKLVVLHASSSPLTQAGIDVDKHGFVESVTGCMLLESFRHNFEASLGLVNGRLIQSACPGTHTHSRTQPDCQMHIYWLYR